MKLVREKAVALTASGEGELTLRVRSSGQVVAPTVTLYVATSEWSCDCDAKVDPCMHVAAAVIASAQAAEKGEPLPGGPGEARAARLVYRLGRKDRLLTVARFLVHGDVPTLRAAAVRFVLANNIVSCAVLGPRNVEQLEDIVREVGMGPIYLSDEDLMRIPRVLQAVGIEP